MYLLFKYPKKKELTYRIRIETYDTTKSVQQNLLTYTCTLALKKEAFNGHVINIKRTNIILNESVSQDPLNEIYLIAGQVVNDLDIQVSQYGELLKIYNIKDIQDLWSELKYKIEKTYLGEIVFRITDPMSQNMQDEKAILKSLNNDPFFFYFFKGLYGEYKDNECVFCGQLCGFFNKPMRINKKNELLTIYENKLSVKSISEVIYEDLLLLQKEIRSRKNDEGVLDFDINGNYDFTKDRLIESISINQNAYWNRQLFKNVNISIQLISD